MDEFIMDDHCKEVLTQAGRADLIGNSDILFVMEELKPKEGVFVGLYAFNPVNYAALFFEAVEGVFKKHEQKEAELLRDILISVGKQVEEVVYELRKGVPQSYYIVEIKSGTYVRFVGDKLLTLPIPDRFVGYWRNQCASDLRFTPLSELLIDEGDSFVVTEKKISYSWTGT